MACALGEPGPINWDMIVKRVPRCFDGASRVVAVRRVRGDLAATSLAEVSVGLVPKVVDHKVRGWSGVPAAHEAALARYVRDLRDGTLLVDRDALRPVFGGDAVTRRAGYDWTRKGNWSRVLSLWAPFLPWSRRRATPDDVVGWVRGTGGNPVADPDN